MKKPKMLLLLFVYLLAITFSGVISTTDISLADGMGGDPPIKDSIPDTPSQQQSLPSEDPSTINQISFWELSSLVLKTFL